MSASAGTHWVAGRSQPDCEPEPNADAGAARFGFTARQWGLTLDNVLQAEVVLANGTVVEASSSSNPDLYWVRSLLPDVTLRRPF